MEFRSSAQQRDPAQDWNRLKNDSCKTARNTDICVLADVITWIQDMKREKEAVKVCSCFSDHGQLVSYPDISSVDYHIKLREVLDVYIYIFFSIFLKPHFRLHACTAAFITGNVSGHERILRLTCKHSSARPNIFSTEDVLLCSFCPELGIMEDHHLTVF